MSSPERLQKIIANAGFCSRRKAEVLITSGRIKINNVTVTDLGVKVDISKDIIKIDNEILNFEAPIYLIFNKPGDCLTTVSDPSGKKTVMSYFTDIKKRIYPVGRLDFDTTGLLLMTNDGAFSNYILHPKHKIDKTYRVVCRGLLTNQQMTDLEDGVYIDQDFLTSDAKVDVIKFDQKNNTTSIYLTIHEGHKNQIKKMLMAVGSKVWKLERVQIGTLKLGNLPLGTYRFLTKEEIDDLINLSEGKPISNRGEQG